MRIMPFMKRKKGVQFAGIGLDTGGGGGGGSYVLPTATANRLGGVKIGSGLEVAEDGTLSTSGGGGGGGVNFSTSETVFGMFGNRTLYTRTFTGTNTSWDIGTLTGATELFDVFGVIGTPSTTPDSSLQDARITLASNSLYFSQLPTSYSSGVSFKVTAIYFKD